MITPEAWTPVIINFSQCSWIKWFERSTKYVNQLYNPSIFNVKQKKLLGPYQGFRETGPSSLQRVNSMGLRDHMKPLHLETDENLQLT